MTKAIFFDVDGTLVSFKTHQISPAVRQALQALRERGIKLFLSTGRHLAMLGPLRLSLRRVCDPQRPVLHGPGTGAAEHSHAP